MIAIFFSPFSHFSPVFLQTKEADNPLSLEQQQSAF